LYFPRFHLLGLFSPFVDYIIPLFSDFVYSQNSQIEREKNGLFVQNGDPKKISKRG
jgi:hypothetical protein